jgi:hypothetical protein
MPKVLIHDINFSPGAHGDSVKDYFLNDAPNDWSVVEYLDTGGSYTEVEQAVDKAINEGCIMIIRSATGIWDYKDQWERAFSEGILPVNAHGSNSLTELSDPPYIPEVIVTPGAEDPDDSDEETSFGPGLEMDAEPYDGSIAQSWAAPTIAAAIARQYNRGYTLQEARMFVRQACDDYTDGWDKETGYGTFVSGGSIPKSGLDPHDPLEIQSENIGNGFRKISWKNNTIGPFEGTKLSNGNQEIDAGTYEDAIYYNQSSHSTEVKTYNGSDESVGYTIDLDSLDEEVIDRTFIDFDINFDPYDGGKSIPDDLDMQFQLKIDQEWQDWDDPLPVGFYKARIQVKDKQLVLFTSEIFDVTRIE